MNWNEIAEKVATLKASDHGLDEALFALGWGWDYPLFGAATSEFERLTREEGKTAFTDSSDAALVLARRVLEECWFEIMVGNDGSAFVGIKCRLESGAGLVAASYFGKTLALGIVGALAAVMKGDGKPFSR